MPLQNAINRSLLTLPIGSPEGLTLSRNSALPSTDLDIAPGRAIVAAGSDRYIAISGSVMTKRISANWASGTGSGGLFSGVRAANTTYHVFIIRQSSDGAIDFGFDTSATGANAPSGWSARIIGSIRTDVSSNIMSFVQIGDHFWWSGSISDYFANPAPTATTNLQALTVPTGIRVIALGIVDMVHTTSTSALITGSPDAPARAFSVCHPSTTNEYSRIPFEVQTNISGQVRLYVTASGTTVNYQTQGFIHPRGAWN